MPAPTTVCHICGQTVLKAQTYFIGDGHRACKSHDGVIKRKEELEKSKEEQRQALKEHEARVKEQRRRVEGAAFDTRNKCWVCQRLALTESEWGAMMLIAMKRLELKGLQSQLPFGSAEFSRAIRAEMGLKKEEKVIITSLYPVGLNEKAMKRIPLMSQTMCSMIGHINACQDCAKTLELKREELDAKQIFEVGAVLSEIMQPEITRLAKEQMGKEAERN